MLADNIKIGDYVWLENQARTNELNAEIKKENVAIGLSQRPKNLIGVVVGSGRLHKKPWQDVLLVKTIEDSGTEYLVHVSEIEPVVYADTGEYCNKEDMFRPTRARVKEALERNPPTLVAAHSCSERGRKVSGHIIVPRSVEINMTMDANFEEIERTLGLRLTKKPNPLVDWIEPAENMEIIFPDIPENFQ